MLRKYWSHHLLSGFDCLRHTIIHRAGWWVYPFLDWDNGPVAAGYYIGVGAAFVVVFFLQMLFHWIRVTIARCTGCAPRKREMVELEQHNKEEV